MRLDEKLEFERLKVMLQNDKTTNATSSSEFLSGNRTRDENNYLKIIETYVVQFILIFEICYKKTTSKTKT